MRCRLISGVSVFLSYFICLTFWMLSGEPKDPDGNHSVPGEDGETAWHSAK